MVKNIDAKTYHEVRYNKVSKIFFDIDMELKEDQHKKMTQF